DQRAAAPRADGGRQVHGRRHQHPLPRGVAVAPQAIATAMFELRLLCPEERIEAVGEALEALDALSVSVEDADAQTPAEQALFGEPGMPPPKEGWQRSLVVAL